MQPVELQIDDIAFGGKGVGRANGKVVFVPFTIEGERLSVKITREKKQFAEGEPLDILEPSAQRTQPVCPYFTRCGGCSYQHMAYAEQLAVKQKQIAQSLRRIGHLVDFSLGEIIPSPKQYGYRNRITVHAENGVVGYFRRDAHRLIDVAQCPIAAPAVNDALAELRAHRPRDGHYTLRAHAGPRVFAQTNDEVADALAQLVESILLQGKLLIDAYCGTGFFAKRLLAKFEKIIGIEWDRFAIAAAQENASAQETYFAADVETELARQLGDTDLTATAVIIDPPATGLTTPTKRALLEQSPSNLVYVSCNPPTLARDLRELQERFTIRSVTPLDMFPQTAEIECVAHLQPHRATG